MPTRIIYSKEEYGCAPDEELQIVNTDPDDQMDDQDKSPERGDPEGKTTNEHHEIVILQLFLTVMTWVCLSK